MPQSRKRWASSTGALWLLRPDPVKYWVDHTSGKARCPWQSYDEKVFQSEHKPSALMAGRMPAFSATAARICKSRSMLPLGDIISSSALLGSNYG
jgi:hypothetical protein